MSNKNPQTKKPRLFTTDIMDVSPEDISTEVLVFDRFATLVLRVGGMRFSLFFKSEQDALSARANLLINTSVAYRNEKVA
jgi:hypothetical protein